MVPHFFSTPCKATRAHIGFALALFVLWMQGGCTSAPPLLTEDPYPKDTIHDGAAPIAMNSAVYDRVGPTATDRADWKVLQVNTPVRARVSFVTAPIQHSITLYVYRPSGVHVGTLPGLPGRDQHLAVDLKQGEYFFEVRASEEIQTVPYELTIWAEELR